MCGIAGQIRQRQGLAPIKALDIEKMCQAMQHRGPDHQGIRIWGQAGLGYRRLSIIDLSPRAYQPMANENEALWLVFNGEIYNFRELRAELVDQGHRFRSQSDGEVVLHGFEQWGKDVLTKLEGMFAFALYRPAEHYLLIARDPFGIKPLYYYSDAATLVFASEIKALLALETIGAKLNRHALGPFFTLGYVPNPETMFADIVKLKPGHLLELKDGELHCENYWDLTNSPACNNPCRSLAELEEKLYHAVSTSMISDVPLGLFLSGGLDSGLLAAYAQQATEQSISTFSIGFKDYPYYDETNKSDYVAKTLGTDHHSLNITEDASSILHKVIEALEEPLADPSVMPTFHLAAMTKGFVTVALAGEGGDELFAGYNRYLWEPRARSSSALLKWLRSPLLPLLERVPTPTQSGFSNAVRRVRKFLQTSHLSKEERYLAWFTLVTSDMLGELLSASASESGQESALQTFVKNFSQATFTSNLKRLQYVDIKTMLADNLLLKADKIGMSQSLEMRVPLLNRSLAEQIFHLADGMKIRRGITKYSERQLLQKHFNRDFCYQTKRGFEVPIGDWLRGPGRTLLEDHLSESMLEHDLFNSSYIHSLVATHMSGQRNYGLPLFALIVFNAWFKRFAVQLP